MLRLQRRSLILEPAIDTSDSEDNFIDFHDFYKELKSRYYRFDLERYAEGDQGTLKLLDGIFDRYGLTSNRKKARKKHHRSKIALKVKSIKTSSSKIANQDDEDPQPDTRRRRMSFK